MDGGVRAGFFSYTHSSAESYGLPEIAQCIPNRGIGDTVSLSIVGA